MKATVTLALSVLGAAALPAKSALQEWGVQSLGEGFLQNPMKAIKTEDFIPEVDDDAKRIRFTYGPFKIKGLKDTGNFGNSKSMDPAGTAYNFPLASDFPKDITILESVSQVVDEQDNKYDLAKGIYNHHNLFTDTSKPADRIISCKGKPTAAAPASIFMAGATEDGRMMFARRDSKIKSGYYIGKNDMIVLSGDIVNYNNQTVSVYIQGEIEYLEGKQPGWLDAQHQTIGTEFCTSGPTGTTAKSHAPEGKLKWSTGSEKMTIAKNGYWVNSVGHLHDGGVNFKIRLNGKEVCNSVASYGGPGHEQKQPDGTVWKTLSQMSACPAYLPVKKDDILDFEAYFDTTQYPRRKHKDGGMAESMMLLLGQFASA